MRIGIEVRRSSLYPVDTHTIVSGVLGRWKWVRWLTMVTDRLDLRLVRPRTDRVNRSEYGSQISGGPDRVHHTHTIMSEVPRTIDNQ